MLNVTNLFHDTDNNILDVTLNNGQSIDLDFDVFDKYAELNDFKVYETESGREKKMSDEQYYHIGSSIRMDLVQFFKINKNNLT